MHQYSRYDRLSIGGEWVEPATQERIDVMSPVTEEPIAAIPAGTPDDMDRAVAAARGRSREAGRPARSKSVLVSCSGCAMRSRRTARSWRS